MDGYEATRQLRAMHFSGPIVAVTANAPARDQAKCLAAGMDAVVTKPFTVEQFQQTIDKLLSDTAAEVRPQQAQSASTGVQYTVV